MEEVNKTFFLNQSKGHTLIQGHTLDNPAALSGSILF